ncbi:MAG: hypothetical protein ABSA11_03395 [Candidatus Bathyarchaeia archaeon]|jgi:hypothetical protein
MRAVLKASFVCVCFLLQAFMPIALAQQLPRHQDPNTFGPQPPDATTLFDLYGVIFNTTAAENYPSALSWLGWAKLVYAPGGLNATLGNYHELLGREIGSLNLTRADIDLIRGYLQHLRVSDADSLIKVALSELHDSNTTLGELRSYSVTLGQSLKGSPSKLLSGSDEVSALILKQLEEIKVLQGQSEAIKNPVQSSAMRTQVSIEVTPSKGLLGSEVELSGILTDSSGNPVQMRVVTVYVDGRVFTRLRTDSYGGFTWRFDLPFLYKDYVSVSAEYWPSRTDVGVYLPSASNIVQVGLIWFTPGIKLSLPDEVYPGKSFTVSGMISNGSIPLGGMALELAAFGSVTPLVSAEGGTFVTTINVPAWTLEGSSIIKAESLPLGVRARANEH